MPSGYDDTSATILRTFVNGFLYGLLVDNSRVGRFCPKLSDEIVLATNLGCLDALFDLFVCLLIPTRGLYGECDERNEQHLK